MFELEERSSYVISIFSMSECFVCNQWSTKALQSKLLKILMRKFIKIVKENAYICAIFNFSCCTKWIPMNRREACSSFTLLPARRNFTRLTTCTALQMFKMQNGHKLTVRERIQQSKGPAQTSRHAIEWPCHMPNMLWNTPERSELKKSGRTISPWV